MTDPTCRKAQRLMQRLTLIVPLLFTLAGVLPVPASARNLEIFFIDVEGGQSTLIVTPAGQSLLIDAGYAGREARDAERILAATREAHIDHIDYLLITHFHNDHDGHVRSTHSLTLPSSCCRHFWK